MKKINCKHLKIPSYTDLEIKTAAWLNEEIDSGHSQSYIILTRLAVKAVEEGRFHRETCQECQ